MAVVVCLSSLQHEYTYMHTYLGTYTRTGVCGVCRATMDYVVVWYVYVCVCACDAVYYYRSKQA